MPSSGTGDVGSRRGRSPRILLVEDNPGDARLLEAHLEEADLPCSLLSVDRLSEAFSVLRDESPDLCLLDLGLPDSEGVETVERFREQAGSLPIVVLTGLDDLETATGALWAGAEEYLVKDEVTPRTLGRTLRFVLERMEARRERGIAEERWATVFDASPVGLAISEADAGRLVEVNDAFVEMFGQSREEMLGSTALEPGHWDDPDRRTELVERVRAGEDVEDEEAWYRDADGRRGRMLFSCRCLELSEGDHLLWTVQDITERVERERALEESTRALAERVKEQSCLYDVSRILHGGERSLDRCLQDLVDRIPAGWQYPDVTAARLRLEGESYATEGFEEGDPGLQTDLTVEGERVGDLSVSYREERPEEDLGPFLVEEQRLLEEIGEQVEIELGRQKTRREMIHVVETMNEAVTIAAPDGTVTFANSAARRLFGDEELDYVGEDLTDFAPRVRTLDGEPYPPEELPFQRVVRTGEPVAGFEHRIERSDGTRLVVSVNAAPIEDEDGDLEGVVLSVRDITAQHRAAEWRHLLESSVEAAAHGIVITDRTGRIVWTNAAFTEMTGYAREEALGENLRILNSGEQDEPFYRELWDTILAGETWRGELVNRRRDGSRYVERQSIVPVRHRGEEITHFVAIKEDVTELRRRQRELQTTRDRLHGLLDTAAGIIFRIRLSELAVDYVTPNVEELIGYPAERWTEEPTFWMELVPDEDLERVLGTLSSAVRAGSERAEEKYRFRHADGSLHWYRTIVRFECDEDGEPVAFVGTAVDITERHELEEQLRHQALHDPLTGLANRYLLDDRLEQAVARARRRDEGIGVLMLDLKRFKQINESLGHTAGDRVLEEVARRLQEVVREEDTVARWGGDEFCLLFTGLEDRGDLERVRNRLLNRVRQPITLTDRDFTLDVSVGAVLDGLAGEPLSVSARRPEDLIRHADQALRRAKSPEGEEFHLYRPERDGRTRDPLAREQELRRALEAGQFEPFYQPIVDLGTGDVWGVEPLARWREPERGLLGPGEFIGMAEETGLIHDLGHQIAERACRDLAGWEGSGRLRLSLNVSGRQFEDGTLVERLRESLAGASLAPEQMVVEVTETSIMRGVHRIEELREIGVQVFIDDFGTGYSSFLYLRDLDVDGLKIDMSFVQGLGQGRDDRAIVETTLTLGREMELQVVAEGVETEGQLRRLQAMGCRLGQGYLFARPMPADEMVRYLQRGTVL